MQLAQHPALPRADQGRERDPTRRGRGAVRAVCRRPETGRRAAFGILSRGEVSEWLMVPLSKSGLRKHRGFESHPLRHRPSSRIGRCRRWLVRASRSRTFGCARFGARRRLARDRHLDELRYRAASASTARSDGRSGVEHAHGVELRSPLASVERSPSGLWRRTGNAVRGNPSRVQIPPSPPHSPGTGRRATLRIDRPRARPHESTALAPDGVPVVDAVATVDCAATVPVTVSVATTADEACPPSSIRGPRSSRAHVEPPFCLPKRWMMRWHRDRP